MPEPFVRIDLSARAVDFRLLTVQPGLPILDRRGTGARLLRDWLSRFAAEPVWEGEAVGFYVGDDQGRRLGDMPCEPATAADLQGILHDELAVLQERLRTATPQSASERAIHQYLCRELLAGGPQRFPYQWFKYRDPSGPWRLVWCTGYAPTGERPAVKPVICGNPQCRQLALVNPRQKTVCGRCGARLPPRSARIGRALAMTAALLLMLAAGLGGLAWFRPTIVGRVVRAADGQPISGATVRLADADGEIVSDATGAFVRRVFVPRSVTVHASAAGYSERVVEAELTFGKRTLLEIPLNGTGQLQGRITCMAGNERLPVAGARAEIAGGKRAAAESDGGGWFQLDTLPPGPLELRVTAPGYASSTVHADTRAATQPLEILLRGQRTLEGRVVYAADNSTPVADADVCLAGTELPSVRTDPSGRFILTGVPPLPIRVQVTAPGFAPLVRSLPPDEGPPSIPLEGDAIVSGSVIRRDTDQAVADVEVTFRGTPFRSRTDTLGQFRCAGVRSGSATILAGVQGMSAAVSQDLAANGETIVRLVLSGNATLRGRVVNAGDGSPVTQATVALPGSRLATSTDGEGRFLLSDVPAAEVKLRVAAAGFLARELTRPLVDGEQTIDDITLTTAVELRGLVVRAVDEQPVAGVTVAVAEPRMTARTDADGLFQLAGVPQTSIRLGVLAEGYARQVLEVEPGDDRLKISLIGAAELRGRVVNAEDQQPITGAVVAVEQTPWKATGDDGGRFVIEGVAAAPATLRITAAGFAARSWERRLSPGSEELGDFALSPLAVPAEPAAKPERSPPGGPAEQIVPAAGKAAEPEVDFFGIKTRAHTVGFVVDCSGSMSGSRIERTKAELVESIVNLSPQQQFYVSFFGDAEQPMSAPPRAPVQASPAEKVRFCRWMNSIEATGGTQPESSLQLVAALKPDVIYLLSDGEFGTPVPATMNSFAAHRIKVNTVAFEDESGAAMLRQIADATGGTYRFVPAGASPKDPELTLVEWLIRCLAMPPPEDVQPFREGLRQLSEGEDFGPSPEALAAERKKAADDWFMWWTTKRLLPSYATLDPSRLEARLRSPSKLARWAALRTARQRKLNFFAEYVAALRDDSSLVNQEARAGLIELSRGEDYGPAADVSEVDRARSIAQWNGWWDRKQAERREAEAAEQRRREAEAAERARQKREAEAAEQLRLTGILREQFIKNNRWGPEYRDRVQQRLTTIISQFPGTAAAKEAQQQLRQLE